VGGARRTQPPRGSVRPARRVVYVGQVLAELRRATGLPWRVLNLSTSGALIRDVLRDQLPRLPIGADLVTCGIGAKRRPVHRAIEAVR